MKRISISSGSPWEEKVGYSRVVRVGNFIEVSGTIAHDGHKIISPGKPYEQSHFILSKIQQYIEKAGGKMSDVVRTRMYITNINDWAAITKAHHEFFSDIKPASTLVEVSALMSPDYVVEIEVSAIIAE